MISLVLMIVLFGTAPVHAVPFTPFFNEAPPELIIGTATDLTGALNDWYNVNYGINFDHMYLYYDERDTFDQRGISNGWISEGGLNPVTGTVFFTDTTDFVTIDWVNLWNPSTIYVYNIYNSLVASFTGAADSAGTITLTGADIARLELSGTGGVEGISSLTYNYDGTTDGHNDDTNRVPEPGSMALVGMGLAGLLLFKKIIK